MVDRVVGAVVNDVQAGDLMFVDRAGQLREMDVSSLSINHVALTSDVAGTKTYTMYRSGDASVIFGTFDVRDGADGTGSTWPDYNNGNIYSLNQVVVDDDRRVYRCLIDGTTAAKPQVNGVVDVSWETVDIGGLRTTHIATQSYNIGDVILRGNELFTPAMPIIASVAVPVPFAEGYGVGEWYNVAEGVFPYHDPAEAVTRNTIRRVENGLFQANSDILAGVLFVEGITDDQWRAVGTPVASALVMSDVIVAVEQGFDYYIDTSANFVTMNVGDTIHNFTVADFQDTWTDVRSVVINFGRDQIELKKEQASKRYSFVRHGNTFRCYDYKGTVLAEAFVV